jgi:hypothetical protein
VWSNHGKTRSGSARPLALETNEYDIASAEMPADSNNRWQRSRLRSQCFAINSDTTRARKIKLDKFSRRS